VQQTYSGKLSSRMPEMDLQRQGKHCFWITLTCQE
jgi:hypothetical protein